MWTLVKKRCWLSVIRTNSLSLSHDSRPLMNFLYLYWFHRMQSITYIHLQILPWMSLVQGNKNRFFDASNHPRPYSGDCFVYLVHLIHIILLLTAVRTQQLYGPCWLKLLTIFLLAFLAYSVAKAVPEGSSCHGKWAAMRGNTGLHCHKKQETRTIGKLIHIILF